MKVALWPVFLFRGHLVNCKNIVQASTNMSKYFGSVLSLSNGRFKPGTFLVSGQRTFFDWFSAWSRLVFLPNDVAQQVVVVANQVIAAAYSCDRCCQRHLKEMWRPDWK